MFPHIRTRAYLTLLQHDVVFGLQSLGALETLILQIDAKLLTNDWLRSPSRFLQIDDDDTASEDDPCYEDALHVEPDISEAEHREIEEQLVTLCDASFVTLPILSVMYVQAGDTMYGMHRGGEVSKMAYADWPDTEPPRVSHYTITHTKWSTLG